MWQHDCSPILRQKTYCGDISGVRVHSRDAVCHDEWHDVSRRSSRGVSLSADDSSSFFQTPAVGLPERPSMDRIPVPLLLDPTGKHQSESSVVGHPNPSTTTHAAASGSCCSAASGQGLGYSRAKYICHKYSHVSTVQSRPSSP